MILKPRDPAALAAFISAVTDKTSPDYHHYLAPGQFAARFGPSRATLAAVERDLEAAGLRVTSVARDGLVIDFTGTAARVEHAFHTGLVRYRLPDGTMGQATSSPVRLPSTVAASVTSVVGLDDLVKEQPAGLIHAPATAVSSYPPAQTSSFPHPPGSPTPCAAASADAASFGGLTDDQIAHAYGAFGLYAANDFGQGQHIAVYELEPFLTSDIETFDTCYFGATAAAAMMTRLKVIPVDGGQPTGPGSDEATLDVEDVSAIAPQANIDVYEAPNTTFGAIDEYSTIVNADTDQIVTTSWGLCEQALQEGEPGVQQAENVLFEQAAAQGQSIFAAAGDTGSDACNEFRTPEPVTPVLSVLDPASQPFVIGVGGLTIDDATQPPAEHVWNDGAQWGAGGGGISQSWPMPIWQLHSLVPGVDPATVVASAESFEASDLGDPTYRFCLSAAVGGSLESACREVPDVSAQADEFTGAITIYGSDLGYGPPDGWATIGGTSSATPIWAALLALVNESPTCQSDGLASATPPGVGFASPLLYSVASNPSAYAASFTDVTTGDNDPYGASQLFPATPGYDMASGLGSPELTGPNGSAGLAFYLCNAAVSTTVPTISSLSPAVGSTAGDFTVTITGSGFESSSGTPDVAGVEIGSFEVPTRAVTVDSATQLSVPFPPATYLTPPGDTTDGAGAYPVTVTLTDGESSRPSPASLFDYVDMNSSSPPAAVPAVTSVRSYGGTEAGGNTVDIFGTGFTGATAVTFGGVAASFHVLSDFEIQAVVPAFNSATTTCAQDGSTYGESATNDICQVTVVVTSPNGSSGGGSLTSCQGPSGLEPILPFFEGAVSSTPLAVMPAPAGEEVAPQPCEYDYVPAPTLTSISTAAGPADYASEDGGTLVTLTGTGLNDATLDWVDFGSPTASSSQDVNIVFVSGTEIQIVAPAIPTTVDATTLPVSVQTLAGQSAALQATYAGIPEVTSVVNSATGKDGAPDTGGTPITLSGQGFSDAVVIEFVDSVSPFSFGTQHVFTVVSDSSLTTTTVPQNPAVVDTLVCTATGCSAASSTASPPSTADVFYLYPPGNPVVDAVSPSSGPATGGTPVTIEGENLGCVTGVFFGSAAAATFTNAAALLDCGSTSQVDATAPPGVPGTSVPVTVTTVESDFTGSGPSATTATYTYLAVPPVFTADSPPATATVGHAYGPYTFVAEGDPTPSYSVTSGELPPGLSLDGSTGVLAGTPTAAGAFTFEVSATNGASPPAVSPPLTITVDEAPRFVADSPPATATVGHAYGPYTFVAEGDPTPSYSVTSGELPPGLSLDGSTGVLAGTPTAAGAFTFEVSATNGASPPAVSPPLTIVVGGTDTGYRMATAAGEVYGFGSEAATGSLLAPPAEPVVGMASTPDGGGYWLVTAAGEVFSFGDAHFYGSTLGMRLNKPIVGMAATPDGKGYWLVAADGGVFSFGDAHFYGSTGGMRLNKPVVGMAVDPSTGGYWLVAADGGVFSFNAPFFGSTGGMRLNKPVVGMAATPDGKGYWLVAADGGVFSFGDAHFFGSLGGVVLATPVVGMVNTPDGDGYGLVTSTGELFGFGNFSLFGFPTTTGVVTVSS